MKRARRMKRARVSAAALGLMFSGLAVGCGDELKICVTDEGKPCYDMSHDMDTPAEEMDVEDLPVSLPDLPRDMPRDAPADLAVDMPPACEPKSEQQACNNVCGMQPDGCGGMIGCGAPLTQAQACQDACGTQSDGCGGMVECAPCACVDGEPAQPTCGVCNLGRARCEGDTFSCDVYEIPGLTAASDCQSALLYVDAKFAGDMSDGSRQAPFKTIAQANAVAKDQSAVAILIAGNENVKYEEVVEVQDGVSLLGGWSIDWSPEGMRTPTIAPRVVAEQDMVGMRAFDVADRPTVVSHLRVVTPDLPQSTVGAGHHNHGLHARNAGKLVLRDMHIEAGKGGAGKDGADGAKGADGPDGIDGVPGCEESNLKCGAAGIGGHTVQESPPVPNTMCDDALGVTLGGKGGKGGIPATSFTDNVTDKSDSATNGGASAGGALGGMRGSPYSVSGKGKDGATAEALVSVSNNGKGGVCEFQFVQSEWVANEASCRGEAGTAGLNGKGGGGGGGASHSTMNTMFAGNGSTTKRYYHYGPSGGSGGAGGCGGEEGKGGYPGGNSVGALLDVSTGLMLVNSSISTRGGGSGGEGGSGGAGGEGGEGGRGSLESAVMFDDAAGTWAMPMNGAQFFAGNGGDGATGASGGHGGGGAGGSSFGIYCPSVQGITLSDADIRAGVAGAGGTSMGNAGTKGESGDQRGCE